MINIIKGVDTTRRLTRLKQQLSTMNTNNSSTNHVQIDGNGVNGSINLSNRDQIKNEIETILAADCLFCGEIMINTIDKPFIDDWEKVSLDWQ